MVRWTDRTDAGEELADRLAAWRDSLPDPIVLAVPRGGVVVGYPIAVALHCPLDVVVTKKIGHPAQPELAIAAVSAAGALVLDPRLDHYPNADALRRYALEQAPAVIAACRRRQEQFRGGRPEPDLAHRQVIVVDDGIATGLTTLAAVRQLRPVTPRLLLATPVLPAQQVERFQREVDRLVFLHAPPDLSSVGQYYLDFAQTNDEEVLALLKRSPVPA